MTGCASKFGTKSSYLSQIIDPKYNNTIFHWIDIALQQTRDQRVAPPRAAYNLAMPMVAGFLAANGILGKYEQHLGLPEGPRHANLEIAYAIAFVTAAAEAYQSPFLLETKAFLDRFPNGEAKSSAIKWGRKVGRHIIKTRNNDGSEQSEVNYYLNRYKRRTDALRWSPTLPNFSANPSPAFPSYDRGLFPGHGQITPWTMTSASEFSVQNFYDPRSPEFAQEFENARLMGGSESRIRTKKQSDISLFWEDGPWGITPPGHMTFIAMEVLQNRGLSFIDLARAFALIGMTQCDASIHSWHNKYSHDIIRPETAIRSRAHHFKNADLRVRPFSNWKSYIPTPSFPSYTSGHSTFGAAGMKMLELIYGRDRINLTGIAPDKVLWPQLDGVTQTWTSLSQIAEENGMSRIYGGVHWLLDHNEAMSAGRKIANSAHVKMFPLRMRT